MGDHVESTAEQLADFEAKLDHEGGWEDALYGYGAELDDFLTDMPVDLATAEDEMDKAYGRYEWKKSIVQEELRKLSEEVGYTDRLGYW